ncbi:MAG: hypothetical protein ACM3KT_02060, partial [Deltaproteobacteria bacterium]
MAIPGFLTDRKYSDSKSNASVRLRRPGDFFARAKKSPRNTLKAEYPQEELHEISAAGVQHPTSTRSFRVATHAFRSWSDELLLVLASPRSACVQFL